MPIISVAKEWEVGGAGQWVGVAAVATYVRHTSDATRQIASAKRQVAGNCNCQRKQERGERGEGREKAGE